MNITNKCILGISVLAIACFVFSAYEAKSEVAQRKKDYNLYIQANQSLQTGKELDKALLSVESIEKKYGQSDVLYITKADLYKVSKRYDKAQKEFQKAYDSYIHLQNKVPFLVSYADVAIENKDKDTARKLLEKAKKLGIPNEYKDITDKIVSQIS
ncbi:TPA: tetratricopeptide repeat protein [Clostridioides difficile]